MEFKQAVVTQHGRELMAKLLSGKSTQFTKIKVSTTVYQDAQLATLTALTNIKQETPAQAYGNNTATVSVVGAIENSGLSAGYYINTVGLYAQDPDRGEILYSVSAAAVNGYMPPDTGVSKSGFEFKIYTEVGNAANVNLTVDPAAFATHEDIERIKIVIEGYKTNRNLIPYWEYGGVNWDTGEEVDYIDRIRTPLIPIQHGKTYSISKDGEARAVFILLYDAYKRCISVRSYNMAVRSTFSSTKEAAYVRLVVTESADAEYSLESFYQLELGQQINPYTPNIFEKKDNFLEDKTLTEIISANFVGKVMGSVVENPHILTYNANVKLLTPNELKNEGVQAAYDKISFRGGSYQVISEIGDGKITQMCIKWDIVSDVSLRYPNFFSSGGATTMAEKVLLLRRKVVSIVPAVWGYGSSPSGNALTLRSWNKQTSSWQGVKTSGASNITKVSNILVGVDCANSINDDGFVYILVDTLAASDKIASTLNIDYVSLGYNLSFKMSDLYVPRAEYDKEIGQIKDWIQNHS